MAGDGAGDVLARLDLCEKRKPAADRAVDRRHVPGEQQVAEEQRAGRLVEDGHVVVGVGGLVRLDDEDTPAEVELELAVDGKRRGHDARAGEGRLAEQLLVDREVAGGARRERALKLVMADEGGALGLERDVAEDVVGMHVRVDDVLDRQLGAAADRVEQLLADARAAARVDDGDGIGADDKSRVRGVAGVARRERLVAALVHEDAGGNFVNGEGFGASGEGRGGDQERGYNRASTPT